MKFYLLSSALLTMSLASAKPKLKREEELLKIDNGIVAIGIDRKKGAAITFLSWKNYPKNVVNSADPGRLIQQSYYAGKPLDRTDEGQHKAWSPWTWNPIQGGGVGAWAEVTQFKKEGPFTLFGETIPKLWDMDNEAAAAVMRQWTGFEKNMPNVIAVQNEFVAKRDEGDRWGADVARHQELPAFYFTRNFSQFESYLGAGNWRAESQVPGPPWGQTKPPLNVMACFNEDDQGVAIFSPCATERWNFGPVGTRNSSDPAAGPCVHIAPIAMVKLSAKSTLRYRYWMVVGSRPEIETRLAVLLKKYATEQLELKNP